MQRRTVRAECVLARRLERRPLALQERERTEAGGREQGARTKTHGRMRRSWARTVTATDGENQKVEFVESESQKKMGTQYSSTFLKLQRE